MQRTQIYFPETLHEDLKMGAAMKNISVSEYIRSLLKKGLYKKPSKKRATKRKVNLLLLAENAFDLGPSDLSKNFGKYFEASLK